LILHLDQAGTKVRDFGNAVSRSLGCHDCDIDSKT